MAESGRRPAEVAQVLGISTSTLRRWSQQFEGFLSPEAGASGNGATGRAHRRYTDEDVESLTRFQSLLQEGLTYEEARQKFADRDHDRDEDVDPSVEESDEEPNEESGGDAQAVEGDVMAEGDMADGDDETQPLTIQPGEDAPDVAQLIASTLSSLSDSQQIILGGQQTERQLLGVLLQDNFNLKEENKRIRERVVGAERNIFELKREYDQERSIEQERMRQMESNLFEMQRRLDGLSQRQRSPAVSRPQPVAQPQPAPQSQPAPRPQAPVPQPAAPQPAPINPAPAQTAAQTIAPEASAQAVATAPQPAPVDPVPAQTGVPTPPQQAEPTVPDVAPEQTKSPPKKRGFWDWLWGRG